ncbi:hypothetical protein HYW17_03305 [Candidatus Uhrbacteria bacterium]|nr:hypothetical protein [Candidatus Uhrbacteria bacterium]
MFDDQPTPPANLPTGDKEPDDIFAQIEPAHPPLREGGGPAVKPAAPMPEPPPSAAPPLPQPTPTAAEVKPPLIASRKVIIFAGIVVGVLAVLGVALGVLRFVRRATAPLPPQSAAFMLDESVEPTIPTLPETPEQTPEGSASFLPPEEEAAPPAREEAEGDDADSDGDGLTNGEEQDRGTDPGNPDSDNDGLFDGEEVFTYQTDPLNPDTDGDGYKDGAEVSNGYNPKGEGRLFTVPSQ